MVDNVVCTNNIGNGLDGFSADFGVALISYESNEVVGIASKAFRYEVRLPNLYLRIEPYLQWIYSVIG